MIGTIIETKLGTFILGKRCHTSEPLGPLVINILTKRPTGDTHLGGHLFGFRMKVIITASHQPFIEPKDYAVQFKEIHHRVVILKAVHAPDRRGHKWAGLQDRPKHCLESHNHVLALGLRHHRLILGRHLTILQGNKQCLEQLRLGLKIIVRFQFQQVDLALNLALLAVTLNAMGLEG